MTAIRHADKFGYRLVINQETESHLLASLLAERDIPAMSGPLLSTPSKVELHHRARPAWASRPRGHRGATTTKHSVVPIHYLAHQATLAVKEGMAANSALRAIAGHPAAIQGLDDRVGSLARYGRTLAEQGLQGILGAEGEVDPLLGGERSEPRVALHPVGNRRIQVSAHTPQIIGHQ
ncbi:hypothetical protein ACU635_61055 [[Actinomadura] parvosata]|uniref:hypothetical protein n=1 Tax=[Actinomadura] parvosata TaxID=1955412 RepID=UPI00406CE209